MNVPKQVQQFLQNSPLNKYAQELAELIEPSIRIRTHADASLSCSHFGGVPEVPVGFEFPYLGTVPLIYLGQIAFEELPRTDYPIGLPRTGVLYVFIDLNDSRFKSPESWRCIYLDIPLNMLKPISNHDGQLELFPYRGLTFKFEWMLSTPEHKLNRLNQISDAMGGFETVSHEGSSISVIEAMRYTFGIVLPGSIGAREPEHRILGYPTFMQNLMERECQLRFHNIDGYKQQSEEIEDGVQDWKLLLQMDSDDELNWGFGDAGKLYFWIRRQELAKQDFSNVWLIFQCA